MAPDSHTSPTALLSTMAHMYVYMVREEVVMGPESQPPSPPDPFPSWAVYWPLTHLSPCEDQNRNDEMLYRPYLEISFKCTSKNEN